MISLGGSYDPLLESAVLGAAMLDPDAVDDVLTLTDADFGDPQNIVVFHAIRELRSVNRASDFTGVQAALSGSGRLDRAGGSIRLIEIQDAAAVPNALDSHLATIRDLSRRRRYVSELGRAMREVQGRPAHEINELIAEHESNLRELGGADASTCESLASIAPRVLRTIEARRTAGVDDSAVRTEIHALDTITNGFRRGELILLAGRPSMGKSALASTISQNIVRAGGRVAYFSFEVERDDIARNVLAGQSKVNSYFLQSGKVPDRELARVREAAESPDFERFLVDDDQRASVSIISARSRRLMRSGRLSLVVVDYLQLVTMRPAESRERQVAAASRDLKLLARDLRVPVLVLAQLNRQVESRPQHEPMLGDLRESGSLEQDADVILMVWRPSNYDSQQSHSSDARLKVAKQRNGPTGTIKLKFRGEHVRFEDADT